MKSLFEQTGGTYYEVNGYLVPDLALTAEEENPIGVWGQRHLRYIKEHKRVFYTNLLRSGKLSCYLAEVDSQAKDMFFRLVMQMTAREGVTEKLKKSDLMAWVGKMNNICIRAVEIVNTDLIFAV